MPHPSSSPARPLFLVVEDDPVVARVVAQALAPHGSRWATSCGEARGALETRPWTGLIFDVGLPDGSGLELLAELRANGRFEPALVMTGSFEPVIVNRAHQLRASCVFKPEIAEHVKLFMQRALAARGDASQRTLAAVHELVGLYGLTHREAEIVELIALGVGRERLAAELGISENTLKTMVRRVLTKCRESRVEGVARAVLEAVVQHSCAADACVDG